MVILIRALQPAGEYSQTLVVPQVWLLQVGKPKKVSIVVGRKPLIIYSYEAEEAGGGNKL